MKNQLALFELKPLAADLVEVWRQLSGERREVATQSLAEVMTRTVVVDSNSERNGAGEKRKGDE